MKHIINRARGAGLGISLAACFSPLAHAQEAPAPHAQPGNWNDTYIGARYSNDLYFPGSPKKVTQEIGTLTTTGGFKYGNYVFLVDYLVSDGNNPVAGGTTGAQEIFSRGRVDFSAGKILGHPVGFGVIRDVGLATGFEFAVKNDAMAARTRKLVLGPTVSFAVPRGHWNATLGWRTENNHNGITRTDVHYKTAAFLESAWAIPVDLGPAAALFKGFASITEPKGLDGFHTQTKTEVLTRMSLLFDAGALTGNPRTVLLGVGYEYWHNMFGTPASAKAGTRRSAPMLVGEIHF
ncbi:MAG: hypothetical protein V4724_09600 [Pseudomonadota bacterium]